MPTPTNPSPPSSAPPPASEVDEEANPPRDGRNERWAAHRVARRRELVDAALRAIRKHGPGVGMDEIAAEANTSKTVIYRHLGDRLGLYLAVCESVDARILTEIDQAVRTSSSLDSTSDGAPTGVLPAVIDSYLKLVERDPDVYRFVVRRPQVQLPDEADPVTGLSSRIAENLTTILITLSTPGADSTDAASPDAAANARRARALAWGLVGMVKESADRWLEDPNGLERAELANHLAALAATGLHGAIPGTNSSRA